MIKLPPRWDQLASCYRLLGLTPLDQHLQDAYTSNVSRLTTGGILDNKEELPLGDEVFRQLGATTWMCVRACIDLQEGYSVTIVAPGSGIRDYIMDKMRNFMLKIDPGNSKGVLLAGSNRIRFRQALLSIQEQPDQGTHGTLVYDDSEWALRAKRRVLGPYEMVVEYRQEDGVRRAYAEEDEYLFDAPLENAAEETQITVVRNQQPQMFSIDDIHLSATPEISGEVIQTVAGQMNPLKDPVIRSILRGTLSADGTTPAVTKTKDWIILVEKTMSHESLKEIQEDLGECHRCPLHETRTNIVFGDGNPASGIMLVGEAPGRNEDLQGMPFVGQAGKMLDTLLARSGIHGRKQYYIANILKCRPPGNRDPETDEIAACLPFLERQIAVCNPRVIVTLGRYATIRLSGEWGNMGALLASEGLNYEGTPIVAIYHPAYLLRAARGPSQRARDILETAIERLSYAKALSELSPEGKT